MKKSGEMKLRTCTGVPGADMIVNGRLIRAHNYLLSGVAGCGKTIFSLQSLRDGLSHGEMCTYIKLAEPANEIAANVTAFGWDLDGVDVIGLSPSGEELDEYQVFAPSEVEGRPLAHIHKLTAYLSRKVVSTFLIHETEYITDSSLRATDIGISHLADNILLLRYAEMFGRVAKVVGCLKKRVCSFQPVLRELSTTENGISVGHKLENMQGLLTGVPTILRAA